MKRVIATSYNPAIVRLIRRLEKGLVVEGLKEVKEKKPYRPRKVKDAIRMEYLEGL
jgi:hypothetical protein